jgi:hypothetical protein
VNTAQASLEARLSDAGHERQELLAQLAARDHWFVFIRENRMVQFFLFAQTAVQDYTSGRK